MTFIPNKHQSGVGNFIQHGSGNAVVEAVAGSGKTSTIVWALDLIPKSARSIFLAFNKSIKEELKNRAPKHVHVKTLHGLGMSILIDNFGKRAVQDDGTNHIEDLVAKMLPSWDIDPEIAFDYSRRVVKLVDMMRLNLTRTVGELQALAEKHDMEVINGECDRAFDVIKVKMAAVKAATRDGSSFNFDFTDMLFLTAINSIGTMRFPKYQYVFVDECQDLNKAQQELVKKILAPGGRIIAVGDPRQAIYGFAGADSESFNNLVNMPNTVKLPLSVNYRCGRKIIEFVRNRMPGIPIEAHEGAEEGEVNEDAKYENIQDADFVLCRNTAPLVQMCLEFIGRQRKAFVKGGEIGKSLISLIKKSNTRNIDELVAYMEAHLSEIYDKLRKSRPNAPKEELEQMPSYRLYNEKITVMLTISDSCKIDSCDDIMAKIAEIFADNKAGICFSSIHRAKGLEADHIHIIERDLMPSKYAKQEWQMEQELNLEYVAYTRARKSLNFITDWTFYDKERL